MIFCVLDSNLERKGFDITKSFVSLERKNRSRKESLYVSDLARLPAHCSYSHDKENNTVVSCIDAPPKTD